MSVAPSQLPVHIAIIMDGNGRWAKQRKLPRIEGHRRGVETVRAIIDATRELGIRYLTLYAFSVENWQRPAKEVGALMNLLEYFLKRETKTLVKNRVRLLTIGRTHELPEVVRTQLAASMQATAQFTDYNLVLALNYGARTEVVDAARRSALLLNVMGFLGDEEILAAAPLRAFLDIDPGFGQIWQQLGLHQTFKGHDRYVTIGERIGAADCRVPTCGIRLGDDEAAGGAIRVATSG